MKHFALKALAVAAVAFAAAPAAFAQSNTNSMTNIATVQGNCDIVAIGIDFGVVTANAPAETTFTHAIANTPTSQTATGSGHSFAGADGGGASPGTAPDTTGDTNDDDLALKGSIFSNALVGGAVSGPINSLVSTVVGALPGVFVSCSSNPTSVTLTSGNDSALSTTLYSGTPQVPLAADLSNPAEVTAIIDDLTNLSLDPVGANTFSGVMTFLGGIGAATVGTTVPPLASAGDNTTNLPYSIQFSDISLLVDVTLPGTPDVTVPNPLGGPDIVTVPGSAGQNFSTFLGLFTALGRIDADGQPLTEGEYADIAIAEVNY